MLTDYVQAALRKAKYKILPDGEGFFGEVPPFDRIIETVARLEEEINRQP